MPKESLVEESYRYHLGENVFLYTFEIKDVTMNLRITAIFRRITILHALF